MYDHVRFWHLADIGLCAAHVRFWGKADIAGADILKVHCY